MNYVNIISIFREFLISFYRLFNFIAIIVTFFYIISLSRAVRKFAYKQKHTGFEKVGMILFFGFLGILASEFGFKIAGGVANVRDCIAIFAGIFGGPAVGIGTGLVAGLYRMTGLWWEGFAGNLGYWTAVGCGLATIGAGFIGAWMSRYQKFNLKDINSRQLWKIAGITAFWQIIHLQFIVPLVAPLYTDKTFWQAFGLASETVLLPMVLINGFSILLLSFIIRDTIIRREAEIAERELIEAEIKESEQRERA